MVNYEISINQIELKTDQLDPSIIHTCLHNTRTYA